MSPEIVITAVGGFVKETGSERYKPVINGDRVSVSEEDAERLVAAGAAQLVDQSGPAENAEAEQPDGGAIDLEAMTVPELRKFADDRRINLGAAQKRAEIVDAIEGSLTEPDGE